MVRKRKSHQYKYNSKNVRAHVWRIVLLKFCIKLLHSTTNMHPMWAFIHGIRKHSYNIIIVWLGNSMMIRGKLQNIMWISICTLFSIVLFNHIIIRHNLSPHFYFPTQPNVYNYYYEMHTHNQTKVNKSPSTLRCYLNESQNTTTA